MIVYIMSVYVKMHKKFWKNTNWKSFPIQCLYEWDLEIFIAKLDVLFNISLYRFSFLKYNILFQVQMNWKNVMNEKERLM